MGENVRLKTSMRGAPVIRTQCLPVLDVSNSDSKQIFPSFHPVKVGLLGFLGTRRLCNRRDEFLQQSVSIFLIKKPQTTAQNGS